MATHDDEDLADNLTFHRLQEGVADLQSLACDIGMEIRDKQLCTYDEECEKSKEDTNEEDTLKIIKQTSEIARFAMILINRAVQLGALHVSRKSKYFTNLSSAIAFLRGQNDIHQVPKCLLLAWERNMILIDLFIMNKGLYCSHSIAQDMFDICMETFDWLRSFSNNNE